MNCSNTNCNLVIIASYTCSKCKKVFCGKKCLNSHSQQSHQKISLIQFSDEKESLPLSFEPLLQSIIPKEKLQMKFNEDPLYELENFEFIKTKADAYQSIGHGSFSEVYLAKNKKDQKLYAIKHIQKSRVKSTGQSLDIVNREISLHKLFLHNNIIRLYGFKEEEESYYMILEYANMGTLFSLIRRHSGFDEKEAFNYFIQCVFAVTFLHEHDYAHRDLKPENILLTDNHTIKLCDFGWCVDTSQGNRETFCGTYEYMAPEIIQEIPYDKSIDVWSLGILLYELLHGYSPFRAENSRGQESYQEIFKNIIKHKYTIEKNISDECIDLISKLLTPDQAKRMEVEEIFDHPWVIKFKGELDNVIKAKGLTANDNPFKQKESAIGKPEDNLKKSDINESMQKKKKEMKEKLNKKLNQQFSFNNIPDTNFCLFEDNVFEDTLKMIDSKKKRKVKNDLDYNDIRVCSSNKQTEPSDLSPKNQKEKNDNGVLSSKNFKNLPSDIISNASIELSKDSKKENKEMINEIKPNQMNTISLNQKMFIDEETPTPDEDLKEDNKQNVKVEEIHKQVEENKSDELLNAIDLFEKARNANDINNDDLNKVHVKSEEKESFWDKFLAPFKCGSNN